MPSDLVIVYHRQPYEEIEENGKTVFRENKSPNGIVPMLKIRQVNVFDPDGNKVEMQFDENDDPDTDISPFMMAEPS